LSFRSQLRFFLQPWFSAKSFKLPHRTQTQPFTPVQLQCSRRYEKITGLYILS
jgi:hypothetical protein